MSRPTLALVLIIISIAAFFTYINPRYEIIKTLQAESEEFDLALERARELQSVRDDLLARYNAFDSEDLEKLEKILPDNVDNVRLILDMDGIASQYGMVIKNVSLVERESVASAVQEESELGEIELSFNVKSNYGDFKKFVRDLEQSLRIVDISRLVFTPSNEEDGIMDYQVTIRTYWLK